MRKQLTSIRVSIRETYNAIHGQPTPGRRRNSNPFLPLNLLRHRNQPPHPSLHNQAPSTTFTSHKYHPLQLLPRASTWNSKLFAKNTRMRYNETTKGSAPTPTQTPIRAINLPTDAASITNQIKSNQPYRSWSGWLVREGGGSRRADLPEKQ